MQLVTTLTLANRYLPNIKGGALQQLLPEEYISQCLQEAGGATVRRRRLLLESLVWSTIARCGRRGLTRA
jgi:hypothetical protein